MAVEKTNSGKYHVTKHPDGGWQVVLGGGSKVIRRTKTQAEALEIAKGFAEKRDTTVYLHGKNGRIRDTESYKETPPKKAKVVKEENKSVQKEEKTVKKVKEKEQAKGKK